MFRSILSSLVMEFELLPLLEKVAAKSFVGNGLDKNRKLNLGAKKKFRSKEGWLQDEEFDATY